MVFLGAIKSAKKQQKTVKNSENAVKNIEY